MRIKNAVRCVVAGSRCLGALVGLCFVAAASVQAATLSGTFTGLTSGTHFNLTDLGTNDWAYWGATGTPASVSGVATNTKSGGDSLIGDLYATGTGATLTTSTGDTEAVFDFTDGTSPASASTIATGLLASPFNTNDVGVGLDIVLPTTEEYTIYIWASSYQANQARLTVSLSGASDYSATVGSNGAGTKQTVFYTITAQADNPGDVLTINQVMVSSAGNTFSHVLLSGAAISVIPEPSTATLLTATGALLATLAVRKCRRK